MPQAKAKQIQQQEAVTIQQPAAVQQQAELVERHASEQANRRAQKSAEVEDVESSELATEGEKQWVRNKLAGAEMSIDGALKALGLSTPESLDGLTRDGFVALQDFVRENC
ncbi:hypothetical protein [Cupriavidus sp. EM10]|nr:hypothetical protein [Cupriavidus sp. EM10]QWE95302.1 hypothetical protein KLP38_05210 [Cupriavidus sp. EM10]